MHAAFRLGFALVMAGACVAVPVTTLAVDVPLAKLIAIAGSHSMQCTTDGNVTDCRNPSDIYGYGLVATITAVDGLVRSVRTDAPPQEDPDEFAATAVELHVPACGSERVVAAFVSAAKTLPVDQRIGPTTIGACEMTGGAYPDPLSGASRWFASSTVNASQTPSPSPSPTPTASPTQSPSPTVTSSPTPRPTVRQTRTPSPRRTPTSSPTPTASPTPTSSPTSSPTPTTAPGAASTPTPTIEQEVAGVQSTPSSSPAPVAPGPAGRIGHSTLAASLVAPDGIRLDPPALAGSALLAVLLLLFMAFVGELFNSTLEANYDEISGWLRVWRRRAGGFARFWSGRLGIGLFVALGALVYAVLDPTFGFDAESVATFVGLLLGLVVVMVSFELPSLVMYRRRTGGIPVIRALPWTLPAALACVIVSRLATLEPGYLYGILLGLVFSQEPTPAEEGRQTAMGAIWTLLIALVGWLALTWVRSDPAPFIAFPQQMFETGLAVIVVGGLEAVAFGLLPMRFLAGSALYAWNRAVWAALFGAGTFAFLYLLIGPHSGYLAELPLAGLMAAFGAFAVFGAISVLFWSYFRFRPARA